MLTFFLSHNSVAFKFRRHLTCYLKRYDRHALIETKQSVSCCYMNYGIKWMELLVYVLTHWQSERCTLGHSKTQQLTGSTSAVTSGGLPRGFQRPPEGKAGPAFLAAAQEAVPFPTSSLRPWVRGEQGTLPSVSNEGCEVKNLSLPSLVSGVSYPSFSALLTWMHLRSPWESCKLQIVIHPI